MGALSPDRAHDTIDAQFLRTASPPASMPPASHVPVDSAPDLAQAWHALGAQWAKWWSAAAKPVAAAAIEATGQPQRMPAALIPPDRFAAITLGYQERMAALWQAAASTLPGQPLPQLVAAAAEDRRFRARAWNASPFHSLMLQAYLLQSAYMQELADNADLPAVQRKRLQFMTRQYLDAIAPTNFAATNPEVLERAMATEGASLVAGAANLVADIHRGRISMCDNSAFEVGRNLATTPGSVVFRNDLIELIQYAPSTPTVHARPLLIVPPCINKYYILDLSPANSFVRYAVARGCTTFMISWRNIPPALGHLGWDDYLESGVLEALRVAQSISRSRSVNALGFCVGGTLLASALAVLAARRESAVASATFLTTMLDFADPGDIGVYVSREFLAAREKSLLAGERLRGSELATAFATLRANDLVWNYVVNNYLKGETPPAFDLLHWNADSANLPGPMYVYYLREMYLDNRLREPDALTMLGVPIDLSRIDIPTYVVATRDDHIVPWRSAYRTTGLVSGDTTFTLGASGHIAGVVNPVEPLKRSHWVNPLLADDPDDWLARAAVVPGSWWTSWGGWLARHAGKRRKAAAVGSAQFPPLYPAPGRYVVERVA